MWDLVWLIHFWMHSRGLLSSSSLASEVEDMVLYAEWEVVMGGGIDSVKIGDHIGGKRRVAEWWSLL